MPSPQQPGDSFFAPALATSGIGIWSWDLSANTIVCSAEWKRARGYGSQQKYPNSPDSLLALVHPDDRAKVQSFRERLLSGQAENDSLTYRTRHADGTDIWVEERTRAIRDSSGAIVQLTGCEIDITSLMANGRDGWTSAETAKKERAEDANAISDQPDRSLASALTMTEQSLRESEPRFASLAASPIAIFCFDKTAKKCIFVNERWSMLTGRTRESALGSGYREFIHPDDLQKLVKYNQKLAEDATRIADAPVEARHILPDGSLRWVQVNLAKVLDKAGSITGYVGTLTDISKIKQTEEGMQQLSQRFHKVLECSSIGIWEFGFEKEELVWDERMFKIYGVDPVDFRGVYEDWSDRLHPDDFVRATTEDTCRTEEQGSNGSEFRIVRPNGEVRHIYCWVYYEKDKNGQPVRTVGLNLDVSDGRQTEQALLESENKFQRVAEGVPGMIFRYIMRADGSHAATYVSSQCRELFEVETQDAMNNVDLLFDRIHPDDVASLQEAIKVSSESLQPLKIEFRVLLPVKGMRWLQSVAMPTRNANGDISFDEFVLDITERKEIKLANDVLAKATKTKDEFLANMSHELRTPLSAILAMTEGLQKGLFGETTDRQLASLNVVQESGLHLLDLINEVLDLAKIESGKVELNLSEVDVSRLCESSLSLVSQQADNKNIELVFEAPKDLPKFVGDEKLLRQVLINLLSNSVKFTPKNGQVKLEVEKLTHTDVNALDVLKFSIADNGIGIEADKVETLFEPFVQVDSSFSRNYEGTGLGLSLVKQFVELHDGSVHVESEIGTGSCFTVELPIRTRRVVNPSHFSNKSTLSGLRDPSSFDEKLNPLKILLAEDNENVALAVTTILEASNYLVSRVVNGQEAVDCARETKPDLILMDIQMPVLDGLEAIRQIRAMTEFTETPIIALSGFAMPEDSNDCIKAGANKFLSKPCPMSQLLAEIGKLIDSDVRKLEGAS